jgi:ankyrin repeat protein
MANHCMRGQVLKDGTVARGTRDSLTRAVARGDVAVVRRMVQDDNIDPNDRIHMDRDGWTPLHRACALGMAAVVDVLLDAGADPSVTDCDNFSPMHRAVFGGDPEIIASLNAFVPRKANTLLGGNTERSLAASFRHRDIVRLLDGETVSKPA